VALERGRKKKSVREGLKAKSVCGIPSAGSRLMVAFRTGMTSGLVAPGFGEAGVADGEPGDLAVPAVGGKV